MDEKHLSNNIHSYKNVSFLAQHSRTIINGKDNVKQLLPVVETDEKHGHERYGEDGMVFHKDTIILISSMIIMIIVGKCTSHLQKIILNQLFTVLI